MNLRYSHSSIPLVWTVRQFNLVLVFVFVFLSSPIEYLAWTKVSFNPNSAPAFIRDGKQIEMQSANNSDKQYNAPRSWCALKFELSSCSRVVCAFTKGSSQGRARSSRFINVWCRAPSVCHPYTTQEQQSANLIFSANIRIQEYYNFCEQQLFENRRHFQVIFILMMSRFPGLFTGDGPLEESSQAGAEGRVTNQCGCRSLLCPTKYYTCIFFS